MSGKRVLVTGAAGFVGAVLARRLLALGHRVSIVARTTTDRWRFRGIEKDLESLEVDLRNEEDVRALLLRIKPDVIYHLAAHGAYPFQTDADAVIQTNILGTWNLLKASAAVDYEVFVNTGSSSEYGWKEFAMRETDLLEPNSYYSVAKCAQTLLCQHFAKTHRKPVVTFRLFSVYGPWEEPSRLIPTLIRRCLAGEELELVPPETARDFVYVDDVVDAYLRLDELQKLGGEILNIGTGVQSTIRDVVAAVLAETHANVTCHWGRMKPRIWDSTIWVADITKSGRLLRWRPETTLAHGIAKTVAWTREQRA
jgi:nucleoside-diphosphate-sugar epimerase